MAGDEKADKTRVYLERAKSLEGKARWAVNIAFAILGAAAAFSRFADTRIAQLEIIIAGLVASIGEILASYILDGWAEDIWEKLLKDPSRGSKATLLIGIGVLLFGVAILIAVVMGWW